MPEPLKLDVKNIPWEVPLNLRQSLQGIVSINMIHVAQWNCTEALFKGAGQLLKASKFLLLYGPFKVNNKHTSQSNYFFDKSLKIKNALWGIRNIESYRRSKKEWFFSGGCY